jgi:hypothetical protein
MTTDLVLQTMTLTENRPVLSSERAPHKNKTVPVKINIWSWAPEGGLDTKTTKTDWLTVSRNVTLTLTVKQNISGQNRSSREKVSRVSRRRPARIWARDQRNWTESSVRNWQLQNNGKKEIRLWKEDFMCDMKWQWDCYKSVARIRLVKNKNSLACGTMNWKVCRIAIALYCL